MGDKILLGMLQTFAVLNCYFGVKYLSKFEYSWFIYIYDVLWFLLAFLSSLLGLAGMSKSSHFIFSKFIWHLLKLTGRMEPPQLSWICNMLQIKTNVLPSSSRLLFFSSVVTKLFGEQDRKTQWTMQHHYLFAWLAIVIGYPCIVTHSWMAYHQSPIAHVIFLIITFTFKKKNFLLDWQ